MAKKISEKPSGWINFSKKLDPDLILKIYARGEKFTTVFYFRIPAGSLDRFLDGNLKGCPVFDLPFSREIEGGFKS